MRRMGGACSMQRSGSARGDQNHSNDRRGGRDSRNTCYIEGRRLSRHSVVGALPDDSISHLFPVSDNYVMEDDGRRSPKSLADLCTETLCRSLAYLDGELPPGLPQDVVDSILAALVKRNALNATTLRVLKNCELGMLSLAGCREVTDAWLEPFSSVSLDSSPQSSAYHSTEGYMETMDVDDRASEGKPSEVYYNAACYPAEGSQHGIEDSSCSTSSYVSAASEPFSASSDTKIAASDRDADDEMDDSKHYEHYMQYETAQNSPITSNMTLLDLRGSQRLTDKGLIKLASLNNLEVARLDNCFSIVGRGLLAFSTSYRLHTLSLANCRRLTDEAIINIAHLSSLEALSLDGCRCLTDRSLAALSDLLRLTKLNLSQCDLITDNGLKELENLEHLEELSLGWCRLISDNGVDILSRQSCRATTLRILSLARCNITEVGASFLARLHSLEELDLNGCSEIGSSSLGNAVGNLKKLTSLDISYCPGIIRSSWQGRIDALKRLDLCYSGVRDSHLAKLTYLPALEELSLDSCLIGDWAISHLAGNDVVPNLTSLDLADTDLTDMGMVHIAKLKKLKRLSLFYCSISNAGLRYVAKLTLLEVLNLDSREIGDDGLWHLRSLRRLKSLDIFSGRITDVGCSHIAKIKSLESLELCGGGVTDFGCTMLATLHNLTSLNLSQNERITNRGAVTLAGLTNLKALNLSNTRVNGGALGYFSDLVKLQSLAVYGCRGMEDSRDLDRLQNGLPGLKCVRLNTKGSGDDGKIRSLNEDTDDESFESDSEYSDHEAPFSGTDIDAFYGSNTEDSEMEDMEIHGQNTRGDSSSSSSYDSDNGY